MKVLVACEYSGIVRDAFIREGHDAMSCDILPSESAFGPHYQGDVLDLLGEPYDLVVAHPPCTFLSNSGARWLYNFDGTKSDRWSDMCEGAEFFANMFKFNSPRIAVENPVQHKHAVEAHGRGKATQYIQPYEFGHTESKRTGLWLVGLPPLVPTNNVYDEMMKLSYSQRNKVHYASPGPDRWKVRSTTYTGIAQAMSHQWGY